MVNTIKISFDETQGYFEGSLNRETLVTFEKNKHHNLLKEHKNNALTMDLAQLIHVDTAGLAWLLLLIETAEQMNCKLTFVQIPEDLLKLAQLSAVDTFIHT